MALENKPETRDQLAAAYLDWRNNYLTLAKFAESHGLNENEAKLLITVGQLCFCQKQPDA